MAHIVVWHEVDDFDPWKAKFDEHGETRRAAGSLGGKVFRSSGSSREVVVVLEWDTDENARAFISSQELGSVMSQAGVRGQPRVAFLDEGEKVPA